MTMFGPPSVTAGTSLQHTTIPDCFTQGTELQMLQTTQCTTQRWPLHWSLVVVNFSPETVKQ